MYKQPDHIQTQALFFVVLFLLTLVLQDLIYRAVNISIIKQVDELLLLVALALLFFSKLISSSVFVVKVESHMKMALLFIFVAIISWVVNHNKALYAAVGLVEVLKGYIAYWVGSHLVLNYRQLNNLTKILIIFVVVQIIVGIVQEIVGESVIALFVDKIDQRYGIIRVPGLFTSVNNFADYVVFYLAVLMGSWLYPGNKLKFFFILLVLGFIGLVLAVSRQAVAGLLLSVVLAYFHLHGFSIVKKFRKLSIFILLGLVIVVAGFVAKNENAHYQVIPTGDYLRFYATIKSVEILKDHPLVGVGGGYFGGSTARIFENSKIYDEYGFNFGGFSFEKMATIDTLWPQIWAEYGVLGFLAYIGIFISILRLNKSLFKYPMVNIKPMMFGLHATLIYLLVTSFAGPKLTNPIIAGVFLMTLGVFHAFIKRQIKAAA